MNQAGEAVEGAGDVERGLARGRTLVAERHAAQGSCYSFGEGPGREFVS